MNLTHCPLCNARILSTHRCNARPVDLVRMPDDFRDRLAQAHDEPPAQLTIPVDTADVDRSSLAAYLESTGRTIPEDVEP